MEFMQVIAFTIVALLLVVSPGPNGLLIAKTVPTSGKSAGFANIVGFLAAFYVHGTLSILGISVLLTKSSEAFFIVKVLGAIYLTWLGAKSLMGAFKAEDVKPKKITPSQQKTLIKAFFEGFLTNALNPKVSMFYLAAFPQFIPNSENAIFYAFLLVSIHSLINIVWFSSMVILLSRIKSFAKNQLLQRLLKGLTGIIFVGFGAKLLTLQK